MMTDQTTGKIVESDWLHEKVAFDFGSEERDLVDKGDEAAGYHSMFQLIQKDQKADLTKCSLDENDPKINTSTSHRFEQDIVLDTDYDHEVAPHCGKSLSNLFLSLPPVMPNDSNQTSSVGNLEADMAISDLFGLGLPRGSLLNQSFASPQSYRHHQQQHAPMHAHRHSTSSSYNNQQAYDDDNGYSSMQSNFDIPGTPNSLNTSGSPSTPGSVYSNPYNFPTYTSTSSPSSYKSHHSHGGSPPSSAIFGRPIRGTSVSYSDCNNSSIDYQHATTACVASRSDSPAVSEESGEPSSLNDMMSCLSLSHLNTNHMCHQRPQRLPTFNRDMDVFNNRMTMQQQHNVSIKKCMCSSNGSGNNLHQEHGLTSLRHHHCCQSNNSMMSSHSTCSNDSSSQSLDRAAKYHRSAASNCEAMYTWSGIIPETTIKSAAYSSKVFLGGLQWDMTEALLVQAFKQFGQVRVEWPGKEQSASQPKGYAYIIFESEKNVRLLLANCTHDCTNGSNWYYRLSSKRMKGKEIQVIPWILTNTNYSKSSSQRLDPNKTVFVGALHGMLTAEGLAKIMDDLFDDVIFVGVDTDKYKYPIGSARVTFSTKKSYKKAVAAAFIVIKTSKFIKKVQVDPYLEDSVCSGCFIQQGPYFCRDKMCFRYFCRTCWIHQHSFEFTSNHRPLSRNNKSIQIVELTKSSYGAASSPASIYRGSHFPTY